MPVLHRSLIQSLPVFSAMDAAELDEVIARATALRIPKGTAVFEQGEAATTFYVLLNGRLKVVKTTPDGKQVVIRFVVPGRHLWHRQGVQPQGLSGDRDRARGQRHARLGHGDLGRFHGASSGFRAQRHADDGAAHRGCPHETEGDVDAGCGASRGQRRAPPRHPVGRKVDDGVRVDFPVTRQEIAEVSGTTLHSVSRVLSAWENAGLVVVGRQKVIVRDMERLARIAEGGAAAARGS